MVYTGAAFSQDHMFKWGYNARSELEMADQRLGTDPDNPGNRMTPGDHEYRYDNIGNRTTFQLDGDEPRAYSRNNLNQYTEIQPAGTTPAYDADGNLANLEDEDYVWDGENRLAACVPPRGR